MKKIDFGRVIGAIANIGVLVGILFLAIELRQNNDFARAEARNSLTQSRYTLLEMQRDPRWIVATEKANSGQDLTFEDSIMLSSVRSAVFNHFENAFIQWQLGVYSEGQFNAEAWALRSALQDASYEQHWDEMQSSVSVEFREFVNSIIERNAD